MGKIFQIITKLIYENQRALTLSFFILGAIYLATNWAANRINTKYLIEGTAQAASDLFLGTLSLSLIKILGASVISQYLFAKFLATPSLNNTDRFRATVKIFAFLFIGALAIIGFIIVVVTPLMHLARTLRFDGLAFWSLVFWLSLPILIFAGHFATRLILVLPNWAEGKRRTLRQAFAVTIYHGAMVMRLNIMLIFILAALCVLNSLSQSQAAIFAFSFAMSMGVLFIILLVAAVYNFLKLDKAQ